MESTRVKINGMEVIRFKAKGKAVKTIMQGLKRMDYNSLDWNEEMTVMDANAAFGGVIIMRAHVEFSDKGRAVGDIIAIDTNRHRSEITSEEWKELLNSEEWKDALK